MSEPNSPRSIILSLSLSNYPIKQATGKVTVRVEIFRFMVPLFQSYCIRSGKLYTCSFETTFPRDILIIRSGLGPMISIII